MMTFMVTEINREKQWNKLFQTLEKQDHKTVIWKWFIWQYDDFGASTPWVAQGGIFDNEFPPTFLDGVTKMRGIDS